MQVLPEDDGCADPNVPHGCDADGEKRRVFPRSLVIPGTLPSWHLLTDGKTQTEGTGPSRGRGRGRGRGAKAKAEQAQGKRRAGR